jgi:hypothetical protein
MTEFDIAKYRQEIRQLSNERLVFLLKQIGRNGETSLSATCRDVIEAEQQGRARVGVIITESPTSHYPV